MRCCWELRDHATYHYLWKTKSKTTTTTKTKPTTKTTTKTQNKTKTKTKTMFLVPRFTVFPGHGLWFGFACGLGLGFGHS